MYRPKLSLRAIGTMVPKVTKPALSKQGLDQARLVLEWHLIVGQDLAKFCAPEKLAFQYLEGRRREGCLTLRVSSGVALEFQHMTVSLLERINQYFGYRAVTRLVFKHGLVGGALSPARAPVKAPAPPPSAQTRACVEEMVADLSDDMRSALTTIGLNIFKTPR